MNTSSTPQLNPTPVAMYVAWATALLASTASIYFIELAGNVAATFCWVNRMLIFGIFLVLTVGLLDKNPGARRFAWPFVIVGLPISLYQQLVHWNIVYVEPQACSASWVCSTKYFELFGFITQSTLCLASFIVIAIALWKLKPSQA